jgi:hypothetical protein
MIIDGEWCEDGGGQTLQLGEFIRGRIYQRGGGSIYAGRWIAILNGQHLIETSWENHAKALVEQAICAELHRIVPAFKLIKRRAPPADARWEFNGAAIWYPHSDGR